MIENEIAAAEEEGSADDVGDEDDYEEDIGNNRTQVGKFLYHFYRLSTSYD